MILKASVTTDLSHYNRLIEFVERFEILNHNQFGFRKKQPTSLALVHLTNKIASAIDRKEQTAGVFLDLSKAFDTLDHEILFNKLEQFASVEWLCNGSKVTSRAANS